MLPKILSFVDVETTGTSCTYDRIIEIGILRIENNKLVRKFESLVNPQTSLDPFIQSFTGITPEELDGAPTFNQIKGEILEILKNSTFIAHNVRFDYGFIRNEFKRQDIYFRLKHFCTVKLARYLFPELGKYNLDMLIESFHLRCKRRHRAFDDADILWQFFKKSQKLVSKDRFSQAINLALKKPTIPINISENVLDDLPESPGVYIFYGENELPLYIGKSLNIKERVLNHFSSDVLSAKEMKIARQIRRIETVKTAGELGALLLESNLIKKFKPLYNRMLRNSRKLKAVKKVITSEGYNTIEINDMENITIEEIDQVIGVFKSEKEINENLYSLAKDHFLCNKLLRLEKTKKSCFAYHLGLCFGACKGKENKLKYNLRFDEAFYKLKIRSWPFRGPIIIKETGDNYEGFVIDKWCLLGKITHREIDSEGLKKEYLFDYDAYKIILRYLKNINNIQKIEELQNVNLSMNKRRYGSFE